MENTDTPVTTSSGSSIRDEIDTLPPLDRRICELCLIEGHSYTEAATMLGLSVGAVTQRVSRSRARLKKAVMHDEH
ncbi:sigma-70 family RNA polymerase sigma factor [Curtobacterium sp. CFBP9011]|uniref:RNA polymerase sigma factor n=1 Tax=Curtobacterium sp. CFBP9011 TaxID=3096530 RepID=UPI002A6A2D01|nr:sigma-70 family RNA polymerase sigma factor [Curtobacterium sp. CFBP9011]MDY1005881.1 sigma-70 family RNA polymerase sigma factor [Curtobacterium sp. CFBP9011]